MLLIHVLHQLAQMAKTLCAFLALVGQVGHRSSTIGMIPPIRQERIAPTSVSLHKIVNLLTRIILSAAPSAESTLNMLNGVCGRFESNVSTHGAMKLTRTVDLHVHVQFILAVELLVAFGALIGWWWRWDDHRISCSVVRRLVLLSTTHAMHATRVTVAFSPLVAAEAARRLANSTARAVSCH